MNGRFLHIAHFRGCRVGPGVTESHLLWKGGGGGEEKEREKEKEKKKEKEPGEAGPRSPLLSRSRGGRVLDSMGGTGGGGGRFLRSPRVNHSITTLFV